MLDTVVLSGDGVCCSVVLGTLVGMFVFSVMWSELLMTSAIRVGLPLHNILSPFLPVMDLFFVDLKFCHIRFYTL